MGIDYVVAKAKAAPPVDCGSLHFEPVSRIGRFVTYRLVQLS